VRRSWTGYGLKGAGSSASVARTSVPSVVTGGRGPPRGGRGPSSKGGCDPCGAPGMESAEVGLWECRRQHSEPTGPTEGGAGLPEALHPQGGPWGGGSPSPAASPASGCPPSPSRTVGGRGRAYEEAGGTSLLPGFQGRIHVLSKHERFRRIIHEKSKHNLATGGGWGNHMILGF